MDVDQAEPMIGLVKTNVGRLAGFTFLDVEESSDMLMAGAGVDEVACLARYSLTSISFRYSSMWDCPAEMRKGAILKKENEVGENLMCEAL